MADPPSTPAHQLTAQAEALPPLTLNATDRVDLHLHTLASEAGETVDDDLTKAEASRRIDQLQEKTGRGKAGGR